MQGLSTTQAQEALQEYGLNVLDEQKRKSFISVLIDQLNNFLTILLLIAVGLSFFVGETVDGLLILGIILLNALFGIYQEAKASEAISALRQMTTTKARVLRDDQEIEIESKYIVPGDIVFVEEGTKIPADGIIQKALNLEINEAALTGESLPVGKADGEEVLMGTIATRGRCYYKVSATGMRSKFGQIAGKLENVEEAKSPLQLKLEKVTKTIGIIGIVGSLLVFLLASSQGSSYLGAFLLAISLAVAVVPEGLPAVMTITLSIGVKEMAKRKAIIRKLTSIETLGSVTLIATDKTGTLTTNKMRVKELFIEEHTHEKLNLAPKIPDGPLELLLLNGILCSTATLNPAQNGGFDVLGDPTEGALLMMAEEMGYVHQEVRDNWKLIEEKPFDSVTRRMSVKVKGDNKTLLFTKGAPESILEHTTHIQIGTAIKEITQEMRERIIHTLSVWASQGLRVLAFSYKQDPNGMGLENSILLGMVAIYDAPRPEVKDAVRRAFDAGIKVAMITGDNEKTAEAIAKDAGILIPQHKILTGAQIDTLSEEELLKLLPHTRVFARTTPFHKHRIVSLYQRLGEIVAVTGDGVNDAIALKQADVGVAMGLVGTDVARETADMVITDDNFSTIVDAIEEGRNIIKNLKNAVAYLLSCNITEALSLIIGLLIGFPHIFNAIQLLYINLVTDGVPALALSFSPRDKTLMKREPEKKLSLLARKDLQYIFEIGIISTILVIVSLLIFNRENSKLGYTAAFSVLALVQSFIFVDVWLARKTQLKRTKKLRSPIFIVTFLVPLLMQFAIVSLPSIAKIFKIQTAKPLEYATFVFLAFMVLVLLVMQRSFLAVSKGLKR